ncbi:MAG: hypothetical protein V3U57_04605 [Robiginitomaculum sp.]
MKNSLLFTSLALSVSLLSACVTKPDPVEIVEVTPPKIKQTCVLIGSLKKVVVPAVTKSGYSVTSIESPSEFYTDSKTGEVREYKVPPIENKVPYTRIIEPERIIYVNDENKEITDICELNDPNTPNTEEIPDEISTP